MSASDDERFVVFAHGYREENFDLLEKEINQESFQEEEEEDEKETINKE